MPAARLHEYWWTADFRLAAPAEDGVVRLVDEYDDGHARHPIEARYSVVDVARASETDMGGDRLPEHLTAWKVALRVEADPDVPLATCNVALVSDEGTLHHVRDAYQWDNQSWSFPQCVPSDAPGPLSLVPGEPPEVSPGTPPRPDHFRVTNIVVLPAATDPRAVRIWFRLPRYAELPL